MQTIAIDTGYEAVDRLLAACRDLAEEAFGPRLLSVVLIGSLAHGGFTPAVSDIDVAFLLAEPLGRGDAEQMAALAAQAATAHPTYGRRLSLFWTTPAGFAAVDSVQAPGRFPAIDRLDLTTHGRRIARADLRESLPPPARRAVLESCREYLLAFVRDPAQYLLLTGGAAFDFNDRKALTRFCLFPARFLYTAATGDITSNDVAAEYYRAQYGGGAGAAIVALGLALRHDETRQVTASEQALLVEGLPAYYRRFLREFLALIGDQPPAEDATLLMLSAALDATCVRV